MPPPPVPRIHRRTGSSSSRSSRDSRPIPHVNHPNMNVDTPQQHLQRRPSSSRSLQRTSSRGSNKSPRRPPRSQPSSSVTKYASSLPRSRSTKSYAKYTFQHPALSNMTVTIRPLPPNRIAFLPSPHPTSSSLQSLLDDMERVRGSRITPRSLTSDASSNPCRISPSPGVVKVWEFMQKSRNGVRQLCWSAGCGIDTDPWFDPLDSNNSTTDNASNDRCNNFRRGHYVPLNPYTELAKLPSHAPLLTNHKRRLPTRADVGFANPTQQEIEAKMLEVKHECEWQECSPRICLLTGFGIKQTIDSNDAAGDASEEAELHISCRKEMENWNGGKIPGVPFAGRDLIDAFKMYARFESEELDKNTPGATKNKHRKTTRDKMHSPRAYSVFAPPVDAVPSSSSIWKPRPFLDRPPGMVYVLACPLEISCDENDVGEPLFCTLALYSLPRGDNAYGANKFRGKISEDFFFPAGNWNAIECHESDEQSWRRRKRRAVLSYDPLDVEEEDLCFVVQVFRVARSASSVSELGDTCDAKNEKKSFGAKIKGTFKKSKSKTDLAGELSENINTMAANNEGSKSPLKTMQTCRFTVDTGIDSSLAEFGPQFLTPVSFSVVSALPTDDPIKTQQWPVGETLQAPLYSFPDGSESQEDFVDRLQFLADCQHGRFSLSTDGNFRAYAPISDSQSNQFSSKTQQPITSSGHLDIFFSFLGQDFTQVLLQEPPELGDTSEDAPSANRPQLLADVMGESAIGFDGTAEDDNSAKKLRSKLRRLPPTVSSGYASSFDIKEVLYLPPRLSPRKYEEDAGLSAGSFLNLLYVYPRLIRITDGSLQRNNDAKYSLRMRVVEQELHEHSFDGADAVYQPLHLVYNPSTPAGPPMVESFFTKLAASSKLSGTKSSRVDLPLKDEVKIRLPDVLDRRHFLEFSLLSVNDAMDGTVIAETTVPFIISSKESTTGGRVTTIIPNGSHRIQLGEAFQIHIETRLASSFHISDPAVATVLRDYPVLSLTHGRHAVAPFTGILSMASGQAIKRHFLPLVTVQLLNLINQPCPQYYFESLFDMFGSDTAWHRLVAWESTDSLFASIRSLTEILDKTITCFLERDQSIIPVKYQQLIKSFIDLFDEKLYRLKGDAHPEYIQSGESKLDDSFDSSYDDNSIPELRRNLSMISRHSNISMYKSPKKGLRPASYAESPFSRRAFVATKLEQMQAEAELFDNGNEYFDDDETIVTYATTASRMTYATTASRRGNVSMPPVILENNSLAAARSKDTSNAHRDYITPPRRSLQDESNASTESSTPFSFASKRAEYMANRVNSMAQLVMKPCIAPSLAVAVPVGGNVRTSDGKHSSNGRPSLSSWQGSKNPVEPGSDAEEEGNAKGFISSRGNQSSLKIPPLELLLMTQPNVTQNKSLSERSPYLYELISALVVQSWTSFAAQLQSERQMRASSVAVPAWPYEVLLSSNNPSAEEKVAVSFIRHSAFFLPLCLKSLTMRCLQQQPTNLIVPMTFLDDSHLQILCPLIETLAIGAMREAMSGSSGISNADQTLARAFSTNKTSLDFLIGLFAILHPSQVSSILSAYFAMLDECEDPIDKGHCTADSADKQNFRRVKCSRLLRLHSIEMLAVMPKFLALNYPPKFTGHFPKTNSAASTWTNQLNTTQEDSGLQACLEKFDRNPQSFWLAELLMDQCLSIVLIGCETIIMEAKAQMKTSRYGKKSLSSLTRGDLLSLEAISYQAILCAHDLLLRRHATDLRFQSIESNTRVASMYVGTVLENSVLGLSVLAGLEPDQKVRIKWMLSLLYVLQEAPEVLVRDKLRSFCKRESYHIREFVTLLTHANVTFQHLLVPSNDSFEVLGDRTNELVQESFNCLSASIILIVDECVDLVVLDSEKVDQLGRSVFDALLHLLTTPQSSVTLLRTLGGAAHALDKFGPSVFVRVVGNNLQNWGRIILTLMNSVELSVRDMSVDFIVSLLGGVYNEVGSIDNVCVAFLTVLPEVAAREIALYHLSGLTKTMDDTEVTLWPIRRAFSDVEETDPADDDRVDSKLMPAVSLFCRTGQAIIDGVLVEIRLRGFDPDDLRKMKACQSSSAASPSRQPSQNTLFDADEESLLEAATFFSPESSMPQRIRWLLTLRDLHISKLQWVEAAETLILSANSIVDALSHLSEMWRPSRFDLWTDFRRSPWLSSIGLSSKTVRGNEVVTEFATSFLESVGLVHAASNYLSVESVCTMLSSIVDQAFLAFNQEGGQENLAYHHFEILLNKLSPIVINEDRSFRLQDATFLRRVRGNICQKLARLDSQALQEGRGLNSNILNGCSGPQWYVRVILRGNKPLRFKESTTIPTYFEWNMPSICRVPMSAVSKAKHDMKNNPMKGKDEIICSAFAEPYILALKEAGGIDSVVLRIGSTVDVSADDLNTFLDVAVIEMKQQSRSIGKSRKFILRNHGITEYTVANKFPHVVSRQRSLYVKK